MQVIQSAYTFIWDVLMDWGLPAREPRGCGVAMRQPLLITSSKAVYIVLCFFNLSLRFIWTLSIFGAVSGRGAGMFFFEIVEVLRRTVWAVFRIEWEVVCKVYNSSYGRPAGIRAIESGSSEGDLDEVLPLGAANSG